MVCRTFVALSDHGDRFGQAISRSMETLPKTVKVSVLAKSRAFVFGSASHLAAIAVIVAISLLLPIFVRRSGSALLRDRVALAISLVLLVHEVVFQVYWFLMQNWTVVYNLTIHMCSLAVMFIPVLFFTENEKTRQYLFEILYFWGLGGAVQALFSPDIGLFGFPLLKYFNYFISHGVIVIGMVNAAVLYKVELTWKSWVRIAVVTKVIGGFIASGSATIPDSDHIRCFRRPYPEFGTSLNDVVPTLFPPHGLLKSDSAFRILDCECCRAWSYQLPTTGKADREQPVDSPGIT